MMKRILLGSISLLLRFVLFTCVVTMATVRSDKLSTHPMLFFSEADILALRAGAKTTHKNITEELAKAVFDITANFMPPESEERFGSRWNEIYGNNLPPLAIYHTLFPNKTLLGLITRYMDTMVNYKSWMVTALPVDEVPLSHHVTGFATALDMVYNDLDNARQKRYVAKLMDKTEEMFEASQKRWWGRSFLQNHVASNYVSLLVGGLVCRVHAEKKAGEWVNHGRTMLETNMGLLELIQDGSLDEGIGYVGYTTRAFSQYLYLADRHFGINHRQHPWFQQHFKFNYYTLLPGCGRSVGIADSPDTWFYGPESQLVFLDAFIMRNGYGYWLANQIRRNRSDKNLRSSSQRYTTLHTEYIWYDPSITPRPPDGYDKEELHHFSDLGFITHRHGSITDPHTTYFTFKAGKLHGKAIFDLVSGYNLISPKGGGWNMFNPGHEHTDQTSFTFYLKGVPFVTDDLYSPKYSHQNNIFVFGPHRLSHCFEPWVGQLGECNKFLTWKNGEEQTHHGEILFYEKKNGILLSVGESTKAYHSELGIDSIIRTTLLLSDDLLITIDSIAMNDDSTLQYATSNINNKDYIFTPWFKSSIQGAKINFKSGEYLLTFWISDSGSSPQAVISELSYPSVGARKRILSNLNITLPVRKRFSLLSVYTGSVASVSSIDIQFISSTYRVFVNTATKHYTVSIPAIEKSLPYDKGTVEVTMVTESMDTGTTTTDTDFNIAGVKPLHTGKQDSWTRTLVFNRDISLSKPSRTILNNYDFSNTVELKPPNYFFNRLVIFNLIIGIVGFLCFRVVFRRVRTTALWVKCRRKCRV